MIAKKLLRLVLGVMIISFGITLSLKAQLGFAPWEVFHSGLSLITNISIGKISILTSLVIIVLSLFFGIMPGVGTLVSMLLVGVFVDAFLLWSIELMLVNIYARLAALVISLFLMAIGIFLYIGAGLGSGPRDSIMVLLATKTSLHSGTCKAIVDGVILILGFSLGGSVGVGTIITVFCLGFAIKIVFNFFKFDITSVEHLSFIDFFRKPIFIEIVKDDLID